MKWQRVMAVGSVAAALVLAAGAAQARVAVGLGIEIRTGRDFYEPLGPLGHWVNVAQYGQVWYPAYVDNGWRPYTEGHWVNSDYGWYWESDEPWAWATYHYGRWAWDAYYGWVWVPDTEWAPAWVAWREGGDYCGWAPLPPRCRWGADGVFAYNDSWFAPSWFVFVEQRHFCEPIHPRTVLINQTIVNKTYNITNVRVENHAVFNSGPAVAKIQQFYGGHVPTAVTRQAPAVVADARGGRSFVRPPQLDTASHGVAESHAVSGSSRTPHATVSAAQVESKHAFTAAPKPQSDTTRRSWAAPSSAQTDSVKTHVTASVRQPVPTHTEVAQSPHVEKSSAPAAGSPANNNWWPARMQNRASGTDTTPRYVRETPEGHNYVMPPSSPARRAAQSETPVRQSAPSYQTPQRQATPAQSAQGSPRQSSGSSRYNSSGGTSRDRQSGSGASQ